MTGGTSSADFHVGVVVSAGSRFETGGGSADMTSVLGRSPRKVVLRAASGQHDLRLVFPLSSTADGLPDGGWWPRSRVPATELPPLVAAVTGRVDPVRRITLDATAWDGLPEFIMTVEGREVQLVWFGARDAHTISLIGSRHSRLGLMMIPPDTATILARLSRDRSRCSDATPTGSAPTGSAADRASPGRPPGTDGGSFANRHRGGRMIARRP